MANLLDLLLYWVLPGCGIAIVLRITLAVIFPRKPLFSDEELRATRRKEFNEPPTSSLDEN
jgi:hypothetical protein